MFFPSVFYNLLKSSILLSSHSFICIFFCFMSHSQHLGPSGFTCFLVFLIMNTSMPQTTHGSDCNFLPTEGFIGSSNAIFNAVFLHHLQLVDCVAKRVFLLA